MTYCEQAWCAASASFPPWGAADGQYENRVVRFRNEQMIVKRYAREERFWTELAALRLLAPLGLSPEVRGVCSRHRVLRMSEEAAACLPGILSDKRDHDRLAACLGGHLRQLHEVRAPGAGPLHAAGATDWPDFLRRHLATRIAALPLSTGDVDRIWTFLDPRLDALDAGLQPRVLHHDLKPANILIDGNRRIALCDFDQARGGDPHSDLAKLWWRTFGAVRNRSWRTFLSAYASPGCVLDASVNFYLVVHCIGALAYWHDYARPGYVEHARSARALLATYTGVHCSLQSVPNEAA